MKRVNILIEQNDEDFGAVLLCAVRYSLGRRTYMPSIVQGFIRSVIDVIDDNTLTVMKRDIEDADKFSGYGDENIDKPGWIKLLADIKYEIDKRNKL